LSFSPKASTGATCQLIFLTDEHVKRLLPQKLPDQLVLVAPLLAGILHQLLDVLECFAHLYCLDLLLLFVLLYELLNLVLAGEVGQQFLLEVLLDGYQEVVKIVVLLFGGETAVCGRASLTQRKQ
jgi:hypothetical protein